MSRTLSLLCMALLATLLGRVDAAHAAALFSDDGIEEEAVGHTPPHVAYKPLTRRVPASQPNLEPYEHHPNPVAKRRGASMNSPMLDDLRRDVQQLGTGAARLNLFRDATHEAVWQRTMTKARACF